MQSEGSSLEAARWNPTPQIRWATPDDRLVAPKLERLFDVVMPNGSQGQVWAEVHPKASMIRLVRPQ